MTFMGLLLFALAIVCLIIGVVQLVEGAVLFGLVLILSGLILGGYGRNNIY